MIITQIMVWNFRLENMIFEIKTSDYEGNSFANLNRNKYYNVIQIFINGYNRQMKRSMIDFCSHATINEYINYDEVKHFPLINNKYYKNYKVPLSLLKLLSNIMSYEV